MIETHSYTGSVFSCREYCVSLRSSSGLDPMTPGAEFQEVRLKSRLESLWEPVCIRFSQTQGFSAVAGLTFGARWFFLGGVVGRDGGLSSASQGI